MNKFFALSFLVLPFFFLQARSQEIVSGPMPGYTDMMEAGVWVQLSEAATISMEYWPESEPENKQRTEEYECNVREAYSARLIARNLVPGTSYAYSIYINGQAAPGLEELRFQTQELWQFRTEPPNFKLALGSCAFISEERYDRAGEPYGSGYGIFDKIADENPDLMLWLGDNIYLRTPDFGSWSGYMYRYSHLRKLPELQRLLRTTHHYAIWDDHDFGPNNSNGSWIHKDWALESFKLFWMNPSYGFNDKPAITTAFAYNDVDFFLLDNRYYRTADEDKETEPQILGYEQIEWLIQALKFSQAKFKLVAVGGQVLNTYVKYENHAVYGKERDYLLKRIAEEEIEGVIFLTGDRHHTELSYWKAENGIEVYDLTVSPLTSKAYNVIDEPNDLRIDDTFVGTQNYAILRFEGPRKERKMIIELFDAEGNELWTKILTSEP